MPGDPTMPGDPERVYASMGNYIFSTNLLLRELYADAQNPDSSHDFGRDILPALVGRTEMFAYDFQTNRIPGDPANQEPYWRDVGTIDAYYEANMDLRAVTPALNLYNRKWPLRTAGYSDAPAKFIFDQEGRRGLRLNPRSDFIDPGQHAGGGGFPVSTGNHQRFPSREKLMLDGFGKGTKGNALIEHGFQFHVAAGDRVAHDHQVGARREIGLGIGLLNRDAQGMKQVGHGRIRCGI